MEEKYKQYDELLAKLLQNIEVEKERDGGIYITQYKDNYMCKVYMEMANTLADLTQSKVIMVMSLFPYLKFKFTNWKCRKRYKWFWAEQLSTPIEDIAKFVADYYKQPISIYEDIYNAYYK